MTKNRAFHSGLRIVAATGLVLAVCWGWSDPAAAEINDRLKRQINVLEEVIDETLHDSPYILIFSGDPTHGVYLEEFGVVFTFEGSLVDKDWDWDDFPWLRHKYRIESEDGKIIIYRDDDEGDEDDEIVIDGDVKVKDWLKDREVHEKATYDQGKEELINVLSDYGETLTGLDSDQSIAVAWFLRDSDYFSDQRISRLVLQVKMSDLRAHAQDRLSRDDLMTRIVSQEY